MATQDSVRLRVAAAVIVEGNKFLLGRRPANKRYAGLWEFPGGKMIEGESVADALRREVREELGVETTFVSDVLFSVDDPGSLFVIDFCSVAISDSPKPLEHEDLAWVPMVDLLRLALAPCDRLFAERILESKLILFED